MNKNLDVVSIIVKFTLPIIMGLVFGNYIDKYFDISPYGILFFMIIAVMMSSYILYKSIK
ncbi:hypothetical protein SZ25_00403 [Candidatus Arcanobacter lacustris]|uniref:Uncharacterized protein n=1 Tax=Candidatus Arcanibacter lacustris TaxID=1607817 RepID=A0A0F5MPL5_9RICK|nr:hypothetical protein SZ25_00403 [Candidatus Arcanobacter lacustris]